MADLAVDQAVRDQLEDLDLPRRRLLLEFPEGALERDYLRLALAVGPPRRDLVEAACVADVTAQNLLPLGGVHGALIGGPLRGL